MYKIDYSVESYLASVYSRSNSDECKRGYQVGLRKFEEFLKTKNISSPVDFITQIKKDNTDVLLVLRDFVNYLNIKDYKPRSISAYMSSTKRYIRFCGVRIYNEDFKQMVTLPRKMKTQETPLTKELILQLLRNSSPKLQASVLFAISTGMRVSEIAQITPEDIDFTQIPVLIRIRAETTKTKEERETFLTTEATKTLKDYLKRSHGWIEGEKNEHLVGISIFGKAMKNSKYPKLKPTTKILSKKSNLQSILRNAIKKVPELYIKNKNGINTIHFHAFRKYFRTAVGNVCGRDYAETLMGHNFYMDTYYRLSPEQKKELFLKAEPFLTISDYVSVEKELKSLSTKCNTLEDKMAGMMDYFRVNSIPVPEVLK